MKSPTKAELVRMIKSLVICAVGAGLDRRSESFRATTYFAAEMTERYEKCQIRPIRKRGKNGNGPSTRRMARSSSIRPDGTASSKVGRK